MKRSQVERLAGVLAGMEKGDWNTVKNTVDHLYEKRAIESHITIDDSELRKVLYPTVEVEESRDEK
jgi:hypothetical protein